MPRQLISLNNNNLQSLLNFRKPGNVDLCKQNRHKSRVRDGVSAGFVNYSELIIVVNGHDRFKLPQHPLLIAFIQCTCFID